MSLFPDEDILTREIETWRGFVEKLPSDEDKAILTKLLNDCYDNYYCKNYYGGYKTGLYDLLDRGYCGDDLN